MNPGKVERKKRVVNIAEIGGELVYIKLDDGKKYLLNGDGCWRCGSIAKCFGNMDESKYELEMICEFDFFDEVRTLFLLLLQDRVNRSLSWLRDKMSAKSSGFVDNLVDRVINRANLKRT